MGDYFSLFTAACLVLAITIVGFGAYNGYQQESTRHQVADELGCRYIGSARDLREVAFYDCNGSVVAKLDK